MSALAGCNDIKKDVRTTKIFMLLIDTNLSCSNLRMLVTVYYNVGMKPSYRLLNVSKHDKGLVSLFISKLEDENRLKDHLIGYRCN